MKLLLFVLYSNSLFLGTDELTDLYVEKVLNSPAIDGELNDEFWKELQKNALNNKRKDKNDM